MDELTDAARIALRCLDLTHLDDAADEAAVAQLCGRARGVAAVCVWPRLAACARRQLPPGIAVAAVANFPAGGTDIEAALRDGDAESAEALLRAVRKASAGLRLKVILETGELREPALITRASRLALDAGADFLKTSTGKVAVGATPAAAGLMLQAMRGHPQAGLKLSGGLRRVADLLPYLALVRRERGADALDPQRFRIGASSLLDDIEAVLGGGTSTAVDNGY